MTTKELKEKCFKSCSPHTKLLLKIGIIKIKGFKQYSLSKEYWVDMMFNYWNPLTYIHLILMFLINMPIAFFDMGLKEIWKTMKKELTEGFGDWVK